MGIAQKENQTMATQIGEKVTILVGGRKIPGIIISEPRDATSEYTSKDPVRLGQVVRRPIQRASVLSLRETNPDGTNPGQVYLTVSDENLTGFAFPRFRSVVGLDAKPDGEVITLAEAVETAMDSMAAYQTARLAAAAPAEVPLDL
jgi:hypothetical protein